MEQDLQMAGLGRETVVNHSVQLWAEAGLLREDHDCSGSHLAKAGA